jgi:glycosyltransferase involved in cell wall biosynthesis
MQRNLVPLAEARSLLSIHHTHGGMDGAPCVAEQAAAASSAQADRFIDAIDASRGFSSVHRTLERRCGPSGARCIGQRSLTFIGPSADAYLEVGKLLDDIRAYIEAREYFRKRARVGRKVSRAGSRASRSITGVYRSLETGRRFQLDPATCLVASDPDSHEMNLPRILALLPFLAKGALSIEIFRALRARGTEITVAFCRDESAAMEPDPLGDFQATGDLIDLSAMGTGTKRLRFVQDLIVENKIDLVLQVGAAELYHLLPYWKERLPEVRIADILYNEFGHALNHFLYEACIDAVIVESDFMRDFVKRSSRQADRRIEVVHSGVDLEDFLLPLRAGERAATQGRLRRSNVR